MTIPAGRLHVLNETYSLGCEGHIYSLHHGIVVWCVSVCQPVQPISITAAAAAGGGGVPVSAGNPAPQKAVATPPPSSPAPPTAPARSARRKQAPAAQQQPMPVQPTTTQPAGAPLPAQAEPTVQQPAPQSQISPENAEERVITSVLCMLLCPVLSKTHSHC